MMKALDLTGTWRARWYDGQRGKALFANQPVPDEDKYLDAQVPGDIHLDLMAAGLLPDPYVDANVLQHRWVEEMFWTYRRTFMAPADAAGSDARAWLVFDALDLVAEVYLNGELVGTHDNVFLPARFDVTGKLKSGENLLVVVLESGLFSVADKPVLGYEGHTDQRLHKRNWLRKPQCGFEWDWAPRLVNVGIPRPCRLEYTTAAVRVDALVPLVRVSNDLRKGQVTARLIASGLAAEPVKATLTAELEAPAGAGKNAALKFSREVEIHPGENKLEVELAVDQPQLWWPLGHGAQPLYTLRATLSVGAKAIATKTARIGFRKVEVDQSAHPERGTYFVFKINDRPIFCKGGNLVPSDMIFCRPDRARYETLVNRALEANFNFLRVWGGGIYESDDLYDLCNERGILVWQEFIFACNRYPNTDEAFHNNVKREAVYQIRRLAGHPALIAWCGNNEMEEGTWHWNYDKGIVHPDHALFHVTLPRLLQAEDPTKYYQPSSPFSPGFVDPRASDVGDQHPWTIGFFDTDFRKYRDMICRFPNEGGILGPTALPTMLACLPEGQRKVESFAWQIHDNAITSWAEPSPTDQMIDLHLGKNIRKMSIEEFTYYGGLVQGEGLREYIDNFHRRMFSSSSAIFWMYNDTWPAVRSWTIVDYYLRRTPSFHAVRRAMAPVNVVLAQVGDEVMIFGINETPENVVAELRFGVLALAGPGAPGESRRVTLPPNSSTKLAAIGAEALKNPAEHVPFAMLLKDQKLVARNRLFGPLFKDMHWPRADVKVQLEAGRAVFTCETFAWGVCIDLDGETELADNMFDVWPGVAYSIPWTGAQPPKILRVGNL